jgi:hypothetical protein
MTENNEGKILNGNSDIKTSDATRVIVYTGNVMKQANIYSFNNQEVIFERKFFCFINLRSSS